MNKAKSLAVFTFTLILLSSVFANALSVKSLSLKQIIGFSSVVFRGEATNVAVADDDQESHQLVKYYTFKVTECLKGDCGETITFKQIVLGKNGLPDYDIGKQYVLFLPEASENTGLLAPVGIWQGRYELREEAGHLVVPALKKNKATLKTLGLSTDKGVNAIDVSGYEVFKQEILNNL
ncbi:MAG: hypothetical protein ACD_73C00780G0002 [uncultured bacterium]|nr:MAG: hypothetical protein ACD_73C00780G0002 [uncultured bacterium]